jgi:transposase
MTAERAELVGEGSAKASRRKYSLQQKVRIVRETLKPGASAREIARRHQLNDCLVYTWRRLYQAGRLGDARGAPAAARLLPVEVDAEPTAEGSQVRVALAAPTPSAVGSIQIEFCDGHRLCVRGAVELSVLSAVIRELSRS